MNMQNKKHVADEFRESLVSFAKTAVGRAERVMSEEAAKQYLILPFFQLLGYDPLNPDEIIPEASASFSDKFKNKVDYSVCIAEEPVIAVECKKTGDLNDGHRGELKGYFNAVKSVKLGILTDGLQFELFSDTDYENMMDSAPFVTVNLEEIARGRIDDQVLDAMAKLRKGEFDPADVGADAKRRIFIARYADVLEVNFVDPSDDFQRALMDMAEVEGRRTSRLMQEHEPIVREALQQFIDRKILERVGFASRQDLVRTQPQAPNAAPPEGVEVGQPAVPSVEPDDGVITTDTERAIFDHVRTRLAFLVGNQVLFEKIRDLRFTDFKTRFIVYYKQERKGRLFQFREGPNGEYRFDFAERDGTLETTELSDVDEPLLTAFKARVSELDAG